MFQNNSNGDNPALKPLDTKPLDGGDKSLTSRPVRRVASGGDLQGMVMVKSELVAGPT